MQPPLINNGKAPDEPYNAALGFWLPADTPYGNFQLKIMKLCQRMDEANRRLIDSFAYWEQCRGVTMPPVNAYERHVYANEQAVYLMRRGADELIALMWCLSVKKQAGAYPPRVEVDCIGAALKKNQELGIAPVADNLDILRVLNEVSNAFKHSFVQSDITLIGREEPCVHALALGYNKLEAGVEFYSVSLRQLVAGFNAFYNSSIAWLKEFSRSQR